MLNKQLADFITSRRELVWYVGDPSALSEESVVEAILNYGTWQDVQKLIDILGLQTVADIFREKSKPSKIGRKNYFPDVVNYFNLYFDKYAPQHAR
jgi:hypothetical protein